MDIPAPSFSLLNSSDSQGLDPSDSLSSFPSEPPEIGKWFSSYVYESPEMNIGEGLVCSESVRGNDCEKERNDVEEESYKGKEEILGKSVKDDNLDSKGFVRCKDAIGNNNFANQVSGSTDSFSLGSEPPDIKNWFSSYAYESPAIGSRDNIIFSDYKEDIFDIERHVIEKVTREQKNSKGSSRIGRNDDFVDEQMVSSGDKKSKRSLETDENEYTHKVNNGVDREQPSDAPTEVLFKSTKLPLNGKEAEDHDKTSIKVSEHSRAAKHSIYNDELSPKRLIHPRKSTKEESESRFQPNISAQRENDIISTDNDAKEEASRSSNKENDGNISATSLFISTRKNSPRRENNENSLTNNGRNQLERLQNRARVSHKNVMIQRKALSETTNNIIRSDAMEVTGKWRCPQKSKPNLGPPLKQLRLEQWVRRV